MKTSSSLAQYMADYGTRLRSMLQSGVPPVPEVGGPAGAFQSQPSPAPQPQQAALGRVATPQPIPQHEQVLQRQQQSEEEGLSFRDLFKKAPDELKKEKIAQLEESLRAGNMTIDDAYDQIVAALGERPDTRLSKQDKAMLVMEFGLNLMANSAGQRYGEDFGGAVGDAGLRALQSYRGQVAGKEQQARAYDLTRMGIEQERAQAKSRLAESALEAAAKQRDVTVSRDVTTRDGKLYLVMSDGSLQVMKDPETGEPLRAEDVAKADGEKFESQYRYNKFMQVYGTDPRTGQPLKGSALRRVQQQALEFAASRTNREVSDVDLLLRAESSADDFIRSNNDLFRDMTPEQVNEYRNRLAQERLGRLRSESRLGRPVYQQSVMEFATEAEAQSALERGEIMPGDEIVIGGRRARVE